MFYFFIYLFEILKPLHVAHPFQGVLREIYKYIYIMFKTNMYKMTKT